LIKAQFNNPFLHVVLLWCNVPDPGCRNQYND